MEDHVYQICGMKDNKYYDGIVGTSEKVLTHEQYIEIKKDMGEQNGVDPSKITIISLNYLGVKQCQ